MEKQYRLTISAEGSWEDIWTDLQSLMESKEGMKESMINEGYCTWEDQSLIARIDEIEN